MQEATFTNRGAQRSNIGIRAAVEPQGQAVRQAPWSLESEQAVLGCILVWNEALDHVTDVLTADHFFDPLHQQIFAALSQLIGNRQLANPMTLKGYFEGAQPIAADLTVPQYLGRLGTNACMLAHVRDYARIVRDHWTRRHLILIGEDVTNTAFDSPVDFPPKEQIEEAEMRLFALVEGKEQSGVVAFKDAAGKAVKSALEAFAGERTGIPTGLEGVDRILGGMQPGNLIILAGRPGMGKSALGVNMAYFNAKHGRPTGFFSLEMSAEEIAMRILGDHADIPPEHLRKGKFAAADRNRLEESALFELAKLTLPIDETGGLSIAQVAARARRMRRKDDIQLLIVDYLQLMHSGRNLDNRVQDITIVTKGLKALAKELCIPVVALSQLSRNVEHRDNKRPVLADLRESGSIEQDADVVVFVYREEYYLAQRLPPEDPVDEYMAWNTAMQKAAGKAEVILGKNRHGAIDTVHVQFAKEFMRFSNLTVGASGHAV
jgi:replicative DNA helicase